MTGWEVIIFLFGGAWYVISAIAAAKEKKKKKEARQAAMMTEVRPSPDETRSSQAKADKQKAEDTNSDGVIEILTTAKSHLNDGIKAEKLSKATSSKSVQVQAGSKPQPNMVRDARKAILDAMRKEMGLGTSSTPKPASSETASLPVPPRPSTPIPSATASRPPAASGWKAERDQERESADRAAKAPAVPNPQVHQSKPAPGPVRGQSVTKYLHTPGSLRQAMVLTEVLGTPVSLRDNHLGG